MDELLPIILHALVIKHARLRLALGLDCGLGGRYLLSGVQSLVLLAFSYGVIIFLFEFLVDLIQVQLSPWARAPTLLLGCILLQEPGFLRVYLLLVFAALEKLVNLLLIADLIHLFLVFV